MADQRLLSSDSSISKQYDERGGVYIEKKLDVRGPVVGTGYSIEFDGELYDLNDHYSKPVKIGNYLVRSPIEAAINIFAFVILLVLTVVAFWTIPTASTIGLLPSNCCIYSSIASCTLSPIGRKRME